MKFWEIQHYGTDAAPETDSGAVVPVSVSGVDRLKTIMDDIDSTVRELIESGAVFEDDVQVRAMRSAWSDILFAYDTLTDDDD